MSGQTELYARDSTGIDKPIRRDRDALFLSLFTQLAGELGVGTANAMIRSLPTCNLSVVSKTAACTIGAGGTADTALFAISVTKALTGTCVIAGFADTDGTAQSFQLEVGFVGEKYFHGAVNNAGALTVTCSNASDDNLVQVMWFPVPAS